MAHATHDVAEAVDAVRDTEPGEIPPLWALKTLRHERGTPIWIDDMEIREIEIAGGRPRHGALRSDDHVSEYEIEYPGDCPECGPTRLRFGYSAFHYIAGSTLTECVECDHTLESEEWC